MISFSQGGSQRFPEVLEVCIGMDLMSIFQSFSASVMCDTDLFSNYQVGWAFTTWRAFNKRLLASLLQPLFDVHCKENFLAVFQG